ncbi:MAG: deoxycytidylate deaminase [Patescibacteria group bacterium]|nr:deoxycytidylate deaminase [Patescibacteria group bacterium]
MRFFLMPAWYHVSMRILEGSDLAQAHKYFESVAKIAMKALCKRDKCGAVIVSNGMIIGEGYNAPPNDNIVDAKCTCEYPEHLKKPKSDRTCCMHAEWRAILDSLKKGNDLKGSVLYFGRIDDQGNLLPSGEPYCTVCSRLALDTGIAEFVLEHSDNIVAYETKEYNEMSYEFHKQ